MHIDFPLEDLLENSLDWAVVKYGGDMGKMWESKNGSANGETLYYRPLTCRYTIKQNITREMFEVSTTHIIAKRVEP
jgi:hypothetical protein